MSSLGVGRKPFSVPGSGRVCPHPRGLGVPDGAAHPLPQVPCHLPTSPPLGRYEQGEAGGWGAHELHTPRANSSNNRRGKCTEQAAGPESLRNTLILKRGCSPRSKGSEAWTVLTQHRLRLHPQGLAAAPDSGGGPLWASPATRPDGPRPGRSLALTAALHGPGCDQARPSGRWHLLQPQGAAGGVRRDWHPGQAGNMQTHR